MKSGVSALCTTSTSFGTAAAHNIDATDEALRQQALAEEEAAINHYKVLFSCISIGDFNLQTLN